MADALAEPGSTDARYLVLGTAGHIDHGKSALVHALTGVHPDRLKEEQRRGITIELGFADLALPHGVLSIVDVPGHERFVRQMVAGASGIDAVLLVIAADQAVQPQTREHLDICTLLDVRRGVVALTKCDLVDDELREVAELEVREFLTGTFLERAPLVHVSVRTGEGLDRLRTALDGLFGEVARRSEEGIMRLHVDRSFVLRGFGTVVTGTVVSGTLREGQEVEILPGKRRARIRGLQVHKQSVALAVAGQRAAVNLQGVDCSDVPRGSTLASPGGMLTTRRAWARLTLLPDAPRTLLRGGTVRFHHGTAECAARMRVLSGAEEGPLGVELFLESEVDLAPGDRFILRRPAPVDTVGGGRIVDAHPPRSRDAGALTFTAEALEPELAVRLRLSRAGAAGREPSSLSAELGLTPAQVEAVLRRPVESGRVVAAAGRLIDGASWQRITAAAVEGLRAFHATEPLSMGIAREELRGRVAPEMPVEVWRVVLESLSVQGLLKLDAERVAAAGHRVEFDAAEKDLAERIERAFLAGGLEPPDLGEVIGEGEARGASHIVSWLISQGKLARIQDGKLFHASALADLRARLRDYARTSRTIDVGAFKDLAGVTRKHAIPLLEQMDAERTTRRVGNVREILA